MQKNIKFLMPKLRKKIEAKILKPRKKGKVVKKRKRTFLKCFYLPFHKIYMKCQHSRIRTLAIKKNTGPDLCRQPCNYFWIRVRTATGEGALHPPPPTHRTI